MSVMEGQLMSCRSGLFGRCCPSTPLGLFSQYWYLLGFPLGSPLLRSFASVVPLGHDSVW